MTTLPIQRSIIAVDIEASTKRNNVQRGLLREDMYDLFERALTSSGITDDLRDEFIDRGDGAVASVHPDDRIPKPLLVNTFVPLLRDGLAAHAPDRQFRLRVALHAGDVHFDRRGPFGEDFDVTVRLLDAPETRAQLARTTEPLVLVVSDQIYRSAMRHGHDGIDVSAFRQLARVKVGARLDPGDVVGGGAAHADRPRLVTLGP